MKINKLDSNEVIKLVEFFKFKNEIYVLIRMKLSHKVSKFKPKVIDNILYNPKYDDFNENIKTIRMINLINQII